MKVLIHDERSDALDFMLGHIANRGYKAGIAKDSDEIITMLSDERYDIVLTNSGYNQLGHDQHSWIKSLPTLVIGITGDRKRDADADSTVDLCLQRPFEGYKLWHAIPPAFRKGTVQ